jgi:TolA-binding protein
MRNLILFAVLIVSAGYALEYHAMASETVKGAQKDFENFKSDMNKQLRTLEIKITELKNKAKAETNETTKKTMDSTVHELETGRDKLKSEIKDMKSETEESWAHVKKGLSDAMNSLNERVQKSLNN